MDSKKLLEDFEAERTRLQAVAYRMLGSWSEADDAVQEAYLRVSRAEIGSIENPGEWLTTVVARICLDMLRARKARREEPLEAAAARQSVSREHDPEQEALIADSIGLALLVVLQRLAPAERIAFVLHDLFDLPFEEIAPIVGRSETAARQLASRARRRVHGVPAVPDTDLAEQRRVAEAFLSASRDGNFEGLVALLDPDVEFRADQAAGKIGSPPRILGAEAVARAYTGRARLARLALVDGQVGVVVAPQGRLFLALRLTVSKGKIVKIEAIAGPESLARLDLAVLAE